MSETTTSSKRHTSGVLDTSVYLDVAALDPQVLPEVPEITTATLAELYQGVAVARDTTAGALRAEQVGAAVSEFEALPFDALDGMLTHRRGVRSS